MAEPIISTSHLTKQFRLYHTPSSRMVEWLTFGKRVGHHIFTALNDISFAVKQGEFFGIIGPNGSGKSTLLKVLSGVIVPTSGSFSIKGRVTSLLELGTGFQPDLTGRQNILNSGRLLGFSDEFLKSKEEAIIDFADIGEHIDVPIKYYSSGMTVRLAFAMFAHVEPDVFIVDEALSVGDVAFSQKCFRRLDQMRDRGCTLLFVSHDLAAVRKYCAQAMFLNQGKCQFLGPAIATTDVYLEAMSPGGRDRKLTPEATLEQKQEQIAIEQAISRARALPDQLKATFDEQSFIAAAVVAKARIGSGDVRIAAVKVTEGSGKSKTRFTMSDAIHVHLLADVSRDCPACTFSVQVTNRMGVIVWGTNHVRLTGQTTQLSAGQWAHVHFTIEPGLGPDHYTIDLGFGDASGEGHVYDRLTAVSTIEIAPEGRVDFMGLARIPAKSEVSSHAK